jgi:hypothetical protein
MKGFGTCPQRRSAALRALRGRPRVSAHAVSDWCQFDGAGSLSSIPASRGKTPGSSPSTAGYAMNYSTRGASTRCRKPRGSRRLALRLQRAQAPLRRRRIHPEPSSPCKGPRPTNPTSHSDWTTEWVPLRSRRFGPTARLDRASCSAAPFFATSSVSSHGTFLAEHRSVGQAGNTVGFTVLYDENPYQRVIARDAIGILDYLA